MSGLAVGRADRLRRRTTRRLPLRGAAADGSGWPTVIEIRVACRIRSGIPVAEPDIQTDLGRPYSGTRLHLVQPQRTMTVNPSELVDGVNLFFQDALHLLQPVACVHAHILGVTRSATGRNPNPLRGVSQDLLNSRGTPQNPPRAGFDGDLSN